MTSQQRAYLAGLLDGDGSIILQLKPRKDMRFKFRIKSVVVFYQDQTYRHALDLFQSWVGAGYVYCRNDSICELRVEGHIRVKELLSTLLPYLHFKKDQALLMLDALRLVKRNQTIQQFLAVCELADAISDKSYVSRQRKYTAEYVRAVLAEQRLIPVTTGS